MDVHHVARLVLGGADARPLAGVEAHVAQGVLGGEIRRGQVVVALGHEEPHVGVLRERAAQRLAGVGIALAPLPLPDASAQDVVGQVVLVAEGSAHVVVEHRGVGRPDGGHARIEIRRVGHGALVDPLEAAVEAAHGAPLSAQQLLAEVPDLEAQVGVVQVALVETRVARETVEDLGALRGGQPVALGEGDRIGGRGPALDLVENRPERLLLQVRGELPMVPGGGRVGRQEERIRQVIPLREAGGLEVQDRRHEEVAGQARGPRRAVALAHQEQRRAPALVAGEVEPDELSHRLDVPLDAPELLPQLRLGGAAVARAHGVDEDDVGQIQPGMLVVHQLVGRRRHHAVLAHLHPLGSHRPEMKPDGSGARAAVEREHQGPPLRTAGAIGRVGHEEDVGLGLPRLALERNQARGDRVLEHLAADPQLVGRDHGLLFRVLLLFLLLLLGSRLVLVVGLRRLFGRSEEKQGEQGGNHHGDDLLGGARRSYSGPWLL